VIDMTLAEVAAAVDGQLLGADPGAVISDVVVDSRLVTPGALFVALPGTAHDGHDFVADALARGAAAVVVTREGGAQPTVAVADTMAALGRLASDVLARNNQLRVVGITGSNGKTTTKDLIATILESVGPTVAAPASYNGEVGLPLSVFRVGPDTRFLVLEYGARGVGHIRALTAIARPDIAVELGVGVAHIGEFGSREAIATAKAELVESLSSAGLAVLNADDDVVSRMRQRTEGRVVTFGRTAAADVMAHDVSLDDSGRARFRLVMRGSGADVALQMYGEHQVGNALAAACVALEAGLPLEATASALSQAQPRSRWRMEVVEIGDNITLINDAYNANPDSMAAGLRALTAVARGRRRWAVLGHMAELGAEAADAHSGIGRLVAELGIEQVLIVGDAAAPIADGIGTGSSSARCVADVDEAIAALRDQVAPGDVVLVKASRSAGLEQVAQALADGVVPA
jgi:UDP-N-acetylmuramoyl-tripeptide--D-alanyl-D-alanine ligase